MIKLVAISKGQGGQIAISKGQWSKKYLMLAREELSNFVERRKIRAKTTKNIYKFNLEDIFNQYGNIRRMRVDRRQLDVEES